MATPRQFGQPLGNIEPMSVSCAIVLRYIVLTRIHFLKDDWLDGFFRCICIKTSWQRDGRQEKAAARDAIIGLPRLFSNQTGYSYRAIPTTAK
jgi:hypothetical protein